MRPALAPLADRRCARLPLARKSTTISPATPMPAHRSMSKANDEAKSPIATPIRQNICVDPVM